MRRWDILNGLIRKFGYKTYLELGVQDGQAFRRVSAEVKHGVDPAANSKATHKVGSDDFFAGLNEQSTYDLVFIDGLHERDQVLRDFENSLRHLTENGTIVLHDCNPKTKIHGTSPQTIAKWNGTVWEAIAVLRQRTDLSLFTVNTDYGCAVVRRGKQEAIQTEDLTWEYFEQNRKQLLNLVEVAWFNEWLASY